MYKRHKHKITLSSKFNKFCIEVKSLPDYSAFDANFNRLDIPAWETKLKGLLSKAQSLRARIRNDPASDSGMEKAILLRENTIKANLYELRRHYVEVFCSKLSYSVDEDKFLTSFKNPLSLTIHDALARAHRNGSLRRYPKDKNIFVCCDMKRHFTIHHGETNTGKTYNALQALMAAENGVYLAPLRLLALEICQTLNESGVPCGLLTGEESLAIPFAKHLSSTVEMLNPAETYEVAVIDECQMLADRYRGKAWTKAILSTRAKQVHICCAPNAVNLIVKLIQECGDTVTLRAYERNTALLFDERPFYFPEGVEKGDALIAFSKKSVLGISCELAAYGIPSSVIYGSLPPETRRKQIQLFMNGETDVLVATDAIGMGVNIPVKRIVFMETLKYDGVQRRFLSASEIKQIAGRAGRKNMYNEGYVNSLRDRERIRRLFDENLSTIEKAYYFPSADDLLSLPGKTLRNRLEYCLQSRISKYFVAADISRALYLLTFLEKENHHLSIQEQYALIFLPFSTNDKRLVDCWLLFIKAYMANSEIRLPRHCWYSSNQIDILEYRYSLLDLYHSFCKSLHVLFDEERVRNRKYGIAEGIQNLLRTGIKDLGSKCALCGKNINWSHPHSLCDKCYAKDL